ncbi:MAG: EamA family transporter [Candidatus Zixiibacteriota bacterium]|nr:MAG: EamA family transporter [candidate division Zixibacteria bacterium]
MSRLFRFRVILGFAAIYLIWGSTYLAIRLGVETMPPFFLAGVRFLVGGLWLYAWARARGAEAPRKSHWKPAVVLGLLMPLGGTGLVTWAETVVPSGLAALLVAPVPMWVVLADWLRPRGTRPTILVIVGLILGFTAVTLLINPTNIGGFNELDKLGAFTIVVASLSWAIGSVYSRYCRQPSSKLLGVSMQMIAGSAGLIILSILTGEFARLDMSAMSLNSWLALGYLISAGNVAYAAYIWLFSVSTPAKVATYAYVNPIIALILGYVIAGEALSVWSLGCSAIVIASVMMIIMTKATAADSDARVGPLEQEQLIRPRQPVTEIARPER